MLVCSHEILVVFDSESDESAPVVEQMRTVFPQVRPVINRTGIGVAGAIRTGVEAAQGERIFDFRRRRSRSGASAIEDMLALMDDGLEFVNCHALRPWRPAARRFHDRARFVAHC